MNKYLSSLVLTILLGWLSTSAWGISSITPYPTTPGFGSPSYSQAQYDAAQAAAWVTAASSCISNPATCGCQYGISPCGMTLSRLIGTLKTKAKYTEFEPNDAPGTANPLVLDVAYYGQSRSATDKDWFRLTTTKANQIITVYFTVPVAVNTTGTVTTVSNSGWDVSVRNRKGEILASFPSDIGGNNDLIQAVGVSAPGTYYIVVQPNTTIPNFHAYNLIVDLSSSDSTAPPVNAVYTATEQEPNDSAAEANGIANNITMYGDLYAYMVGDATSGWFLQTEQDWFKYTSPGNETITLGWCQMAACPPVVAGQAWRVTVVDADNTIMSSFSTAELPTDGSPIVFGLANAGDYYIQIMSELLTKTPASDGTVAIQTVCQQWSEGLTPVCISYAPVATTATAPYNFTWQGVSN